MLARGGGDGFSRLVLARHAVRGSHMAANVDDLASESHPMGRRSSLTIYNCTNAHYDRMQVSSLCLGNSTPASLAGSEFGDAVV